MEHADIAEIDTFKKADILAGCYPCTGYSQGGRRQKSDSINYLYQEFDRADGTRNRRLRFKTKTT
jgi:DNA (cytosine-5)-methyltransferase 1